MSKLLEKIQDFLFDIFGLIFPALAGIIIFILIPFIAYGFEGINVITFNNSSLLNGILKLYPNNKELFIFLFLFSCYILGHPIKVLSKYPYILFRELSDECLIRFIKFIHKLTIGLINTWRSNRGKQNFSILLYLLSKDYRDQWKNEGQQKKLLLNVIGALDSLLKIVSVPVSLLKDIFIFKTSGYKKENEKIRINTLRKIEEKYKVEFPDNWDSMYKLSNVIMDQEKLRNLSYSFLAKYNFYRSLSFIFLINFIYIIYIFKILYLAVGKAPNSLYNYILLGNFILWLTFHVKFKRYWGLSANEALMSLFYFISKPEKKDEKKDDPKQEKKED